MPNPKIKAISKTKKIFNIFFVVFFVIFILNIFSINKANAAPVFNTKNIEIQKTLNQVLIPSPNLKTDGIIGTKSISAIKTFQKINKLKIDGVVGSRTHFALRSAEIKENIKIQITLNQVLIPSPEIKINGVLDDTTIEAIKAFQANKNLVADGVIGKITRSALRETQLEEFAKIQIRLNQTLVPSPNLKIDGILGTKSIEAIKTFQSNNNLVVDGIVGSMTGASLRGTEVSTIPSPIIPPVQTLPNITNPIIIRGGGGGGHHVDPSLKDITAFIIGSSYATISGTDISVTVPYGTPLDNLTPNITLSGGTVLPASGTAQDFSNSLVTPVVYTVTATNTTTKTYNVSVQAALNPSKDITTFDFNALSPVSVGSISGTNISLSVPFGTDMNLIPTIVITGVSIAPDTEVAHQFTDGIAETYVVTAADGTQKSYYVTVNVGINPDIALVTADKDALVDSVIQGANPDLANVTVHLTNPLLAVGSINGSLITWASSNSSIVSDDGQTINRPAFGQPNASVDLTATLTKGLVTQTKVFSLTVLTALDSTKTINSFNFNVLNPIAIGVIDEPNHTVTLGVPNGTNLVLVPTIAYSGASISPDTGVAHTFTDGVAEIYTVTAADGSEQAYDVTVNILPAIGGIPTITGVNKWNQLLTADISGITYSPVTLLDVPTYQWKRNGTNIPGANSLTYTLVQADIGSAITFTVTADGIHAAGNTTSAPTATIIKADGPAAPSAPTEISHTSTSVTLTAISGNEFTNDNELSWHVENLFSGLSASTSYSFKTRVAATATNFASDASPALNVTTSALPTYTFTGPVSGNVNSTSTNFTITPDSLFTGTISIALSGAGASGLATPITKTFSNSSTAQTFTITPTVAGSITLTPSNSGSLTNPFPLTYTASAVVPGAPSGLTPTPGDAQVSLTWIVPANTGGSAITDYLIEYKLSTEPTNWTTFSHTASTATNVIVTSLTNGSLYNFRVSAINSIGTGSPSSTVNSTPVAVPTAPGAPTIGTATAGNAQATVTFTAPASNGGSAIIDYTVTSNPGSFTTTGASSPLTVTGLTNGTSYTFTVVARNAIGTGPASAASNVVNLANVQPTPTFSPPAGAIAFGTTVTIISSGADAIYYTTNGDTPTTSSTNQATTPLIINEDTVNVKALAIKSSWTDSAIGSATYTQATSANLSNIALSGSPSNYTFAAGTYNYNGVTVVNEVSSITVTPTGAGTITVDGTTVISGQASSPIALSAGVEKIIPVVTTEVGKLPRTYNIYVTRTGPVLVASVSITASANPSAYGTPVTFSATPVNGGTTPTYQWRKDEPLFSQPQTMVPVNIPGATSATYTYNPLEGDVITVVMNSNLPLVTGSPATSNAVTMTVVSGGACVDTPTVSYEGKTYNTVEINNQCWIKENMNVGTIIDGGLNQTNNSTFEKYCYNNDEANCNVYGGLYQWAEAVQYQNGATNTANWSPLPTGNVQGICPANWHIPKNAEYGTLLTNLGGIAVAGGKIKEAGLAHFAYPNEGATNSSGLTLLPSGQRWTTGEFKYLSNSTQFWTTTSGTDPATDVYYGGASYSVVNALNGQFYKSNGSTVRCVRDAAVPLSAPIGVSATPGESQATVAFTAPVSDGGSPIISYTVTSNPGSFTTTGASSPLTVTGLTNGTSYTFTVTATNANGTGPASSASNSVTPSVAALAIGDAYQGGKIAYILQAGDPGYVADGQVRGLIAATSDQSTGAQWGCNNTIVGATGTILGTGNQNTTAILSGCSESGIAAKLAGDLVVGIYSDWYLPSKDELTKILLNSVAIGGFGSGSRYWSSSEYGANGAWTQVGTSAPAANSKTSSNRVRSIRTFVTS